MKRNSLLMLLAVGGSIAFLAGCDGSTVPTEAGLGDQAVEVVDGIQFKKTDGPLIMTIMDEPMDDYMCEAIDFSGLANGEIVNAVTLFGDLVGVSIEDFGPPSQGSVGTGDAVIYDTDVNGGNDPDLEAAGQSVTPTLGNVLIHQEDGNGDPVGDVYPNPDDADTWMELLFTFPMGDYMVQGFKALDQEGPQGEYIALRIDIATDGSQVGITDVLVDNDSQVEMVNVEPDAMFQNTLEFYFNGSGAIDDIMVCKRTEERGDEGCTPGYWKQDQHFGSWPVNPYTYTFGDAFTTACDGMTYPSVNPEDGTDICTILLLDALSLKGGGVNALARHAAAGWLNATSSVEYMWSVAEVEAAFMAGQKDVLEEANESYCPLGRDEGEWPMPL
jgi:hypothetical protein